MQMHYRELSLVCQLDFEILSCMCGVDLERERRRITFGSTDRR